MRRCLLFKSTSRMQILQ